MMSNGANRNSLPLIATAAAAAATGALLGFLGGAAITRRWQTNSSQETHETEQKQYVWSGPKKTCVTSAPSQHHAVLLRLRPGDDLVAKLTEFVATNRISSAAVLTCVGSVTKAVLRMANSTTVKEYQGHFEIVSLVGTVSDRGSHLHISISDSEGDVFGGHVFGTGTTIYTTAEIVLGVYPDWEMHREPCVLSGWDELVFASKK